MTVLVRIVVLLGVVGLLSAAEANGKIDSAELKKLQGTWTMVSGEMDGKPLPDEAVKKNKITWKDGAIDIDSPHQSKEPIKAQLTGARSQQEAQRDDVQAIEGAERRKGPEGHLRVRRPRHVQGVLRPERQGAPQGAGDHAGLGLHPARLEAREVGELARMILSRPGEWQADLKARRPKR